MSYFGYIDRFWTRRLKDAKVLIVYGGFEFFLNMLDDGLTKALEVP